MAKEFKYIDTQGAEQRVRADSAESAMATASNIAPNSGVMAVDTISRPADQRVDREVEVVNQAQDRQPSTALTADIAKAVSTVPPAERTRDDFRSDADAVLAEIQGTNIAESTAEVKEREGVALKEETARNLSNNLIARRNDIQKQIEAMEKNPRGMSEFANQSEINRFRREASRELADMSFDYQVALGDYQAAEKIASDYADDLQQDLLNKQNTWQMLMKMSEMTDEEKMIANQNFQEKQMQDQFELNKKMATFNQELRQPEVDFAQSMAIKSYNLQSASLERQLEAETQKLTQEANKEFADTDEARALTVVKGQVSQLDQLFRNVVGTADREAMDWDSISKDMSIVRSIANAEARALNPDITRAAQGGDLNAETSLIEIGQRMYDKYTRGENVRPVDLQNAVRSVDSAYQARLSEADIAMQRIEQLYPGSPIITNYNQSTGNNIATQIQQAEQSGYTPEQIIESISSIPAIGEKIQQAVDSGYDPLEVLNFLKQQ